MATGLHSTKCLCSVYVTPLVWSPQQLLTNCIDLNARTWMQHREYTSKNSSHYQLTWRLIRLILVLNLSSNFKCFCNKVSGSLNNVLCLSICLKRKWKYQNTWTVSWIRQYQVSLWQYSVRKEKGKLHSVFTLRLVCCSTVKTVTDTKGTSY